MDSKPKSQDEYLYHGIWMDELDNLILSCILREKQLHKFEGMIIPPEFLYEAEATVEEETCSHVNRDDVYNQLQFLERRYQTFKSLVEHPNTRFEPSSNKIFASEKTLMVILKHIQTMENQSSSCSRSIVLSDNTIDLNLDVDEGQGEEHESGYKHESQLLPHKLFGSLDNDLKISITTALTTPQQEH
ncbi:hypothetical protein SASPL_145566 [Salvia splendens]|uniref:Uncharacterized protein n=1 Tax=Salvia splendens TaxID=180675 RepID=A0A8X8WHS6_SALSN|nr:hypothetical protein SASPL_145566 [Salvia splendens]